MSATARSRTHTDDLTLRILGGELSGELYLPTDAEFPALFMPWNVAAAAERSVRAVVAVASAADVARTVRFAAAHDMRVAVQRTGHGAVAISGDDVLLVQTSRLDSLELDVAARTARVGAGVLWQDVIDAAAPHGLAPMCGSAPHVGVVGFLTGGGVGPFVRSHGLSADYVRSFELVTGDGSLLRVSAAEHSELFWGLRGGKATLGIVTAVEFELPELASFHGGTLYFDGADAARVLHAWQRATRTLMDEISTSVAILQLPPLPDVPAPLSGRMTVAVRIASVAGPETAGVFASHLLAVARPILGEIATLPYAAMASLHADPVDPMPALERSAVIAEITPELIDALIATAGPDSGSVQAIVELRLLGGALAREPRTASAFSHRDATANLLVIGVLAPEIAHLVPAGADAVIEAARPFATGGVLPNFEPSSDPEANARCYDADTRRWLGALADRLDPAGVLAVGQVVRSGTKDDR